jgi:hypothetical protein
MLNIRLRWSAAVICSAAAISLAACTAVAQQPDFKASVGVSYTTLRGDPGEQYIGYGVDFRFMVRPWLGVQAQASVFPYWQTAFSNDSRLGRSTGQLDASALLGHRWGRVGLFGEGGLGYLRSNVLESAAGWSFEDYMDVQMGGLLDVFVARRWSLTYEVRDNLVLLHAPVQISGWYPASLNSPEGRAGLTFHFLNAAHTELSRRTAPNLEFDDRALRQSLGVSYTALRWSQLSNYASQQWLGAALQYRWMPRSWGGVQLQGGYAPQRQSFITSTAGGQTVEADASALVGHRWGRFGLYGDLGVGAVRTKVFGAVNLAIFPPAILLWRNYPSVPVGALVDVKLGKHWSAVYQVRDDVTFVGPFSFYGPVYSSSGVLEGYQYYPPSNPFVDNLLDLRSGVAFHF